MARVVLCQVPRPVGRGRKPLSYMTMVCMCLLALCWAVAHWHELWFAGVPKPVGRGCDGVKKCGKKAVELYDNGKVSDLLPQVNKQVLEMPRHTAAALSHRVLPVRSL